MIGVTDRTVWNYIKNGVIPAQLVGNKWLISEGNIHAYLRGAHYTKTGNRLGHYAGRGMFIEPPTFTGHYTEPQPLEPGDITPVNPTD